MTKTAENEILSVSHLNSVVRDVLDEFPNVWVMGELSNLSVPSSGHWYFVLKDQQAEVRCAMFRYQNQKVGFIPENGQQVIVQAKVGLYEPRGEYQLKVESLELSGDGLLARAFLELKKKLQREGLFDQKHKQPLPEFPQCLGLITSPTGAALQDVLRVLHHRYPLLPVIVYPSLVQGNQAPQALCEALETAISHDRCDVLILTRGGGSLEDLAAFNDETLARLIFKSPIPIISAVGHEIDFSITDFVADVRAPTPSAAAALVSPDQVNLREQLKLYDKRLSKAIHFRVDQLQQRVDQLSLRLRDPKQQLKHHRQHLGTLENHLQPAIFSHVQQVEHRLSLLIHRLTQQHPQLQITALQKTRVQIHDQLVAAMKQFLKHRQQTVALQLNALKMLNPLATLDRGYAVVFNQDGVVVDSVGRVHKNDPIQVRLKDGFVESMVGKISKL